MIHDSSPIDLCIPFVSTMFIQERETSYLHHGKKQHLCEKSETKIRISALDMPHLSFDRFQLQQCHGN